MIYFGFEKILILYSLKQKIFKWWVYASSKTFVKVVELLLFLCSKRFGKPYEDVRGFYFFNIFSFSLTIFFLSFSLLVPYFFLQQVFTEEVVKELGPINITRSQLKINSPVITSAVAELIPWKYLKDRIKEVDLRHCSLTKVPFGFGDLDDGKIKKIRLDGNPLTGFSRSFLGCSGPDIVRGIRQVRKDNKAKWNEVRLLVIGDAAVGLFLFLFLFFCLSFFFLCGESEKKTSYSQREQEKQR